MAFYALVYAVFKRVTNADSNLNREYSESLLQGPPNLGARADNISERGGEGKGYDGKGKEDGRGEERR